MEPHVGLLPGCLVVAAGPAPAGGCKVGLGYQTPATELPESFSEMSATSMGFAEETGGEFRWWLRLAEPRLTDLVERATAANPLIPIAGVHLRHARAAREAAQALLYPEIHAGASRFRGSSGALDVLEAQHQVDQADMPLAQSEVAVTVNAVTLRKALGGGWRVAESPPTSEGPREPPIPTRRSSDGCSITPNGKDTTDRERSDSRG